MIHVTCDLCGKELPQSQDVRYVVKIEAFPAHDPAKITEADLEDDHMEAVSQILQDMQDNLKGPDLPSPHQSFRFDLCGECQRKFVRDPLGKGVGQRFDFSEN